MSEQNLREQLAELEALGATAVADANALASDAVAFDPCAILKPLKLVKTIVCTLSIFVPPLKLACEALEKIIEGLEKHCE
ncbi:MAG: hypothetical protein GKS06_20460 [Acidobacteria bacterium]|nr:hypothetical protein [Acidobacteriota bacterium]